MYISRLSFTLYNNTLLQLCLFFTTLLLHLGNLPLYRSGLNMMKYSLCHPEQFSHPKVAFFLGFIYMSILIISEWINVIKGTQRKTPQELITSYIGFKAISDLPKIYMGSMHDLPIKKAIGKLTATKGRKDPQNKEVNNCLLNTLYVISKWFYTSFYFYFFPFCVIYLPLVVLLYDKE